MKGERTMSAESMETLSKRAAKRKYPATSTVGRGRTTKELVGNEMDITTWSDELISIKLGDSLQYYQQRRSNMGTVWWIIYSMPCSS